jgi:Holliday junction DNA helicase RuvA
MIHFVEGTLDFANDNFIVINVGGVGFKVFASANTVAELPAIGETTRLYTSMSVKEDDISLFGFMSTDELSVFELITGVSGIGAKTGIGMLSALTPQEIRLAIATDDAKTLSKAPGIGEKTAQRAILELRGKIKTADIVSTGATNRQSGQSGLATEGKRDALDALIALGYSRSEAVKAILEITEDDLSSQQIIKQALRKLSGRK